MILRKTIPLRFIDKLSINILFPTREILGRFRGSDFDVIFVESFELLPGVIDRFATSRIVFDAREFYPAQNETKWWFRFFEKNHRIRVLREYLPKCDEVITVSPGLQDRYLNDFGIPTTLLRSTPSWEKLPIRGVDPEDIKLVYHGGANLDRKLGNLLTLLPHLDKRFSLHLYLTGNQQEILRLRNSAQMDTRVHFYDPVPMTDIPRTMNNYDIGLVYYEPLTFNLYRCLPNKFFEYIQARLMVAIGPSPDMASLVSQFELGVVAKRFSLTDLALALNDLTPERINRAKHNADAAAKLLNFDLESKALFSLLRLSD
jgi:hypothetical protein